jgi:sarcosine oxidase subunit beta
VFDVIIIGGGIMGLSTSYRLATEGCSTLLIEKRSAGFEASTRNAGGVRQQFRDPRETELAQYSVEIWKGLDKELSSDIEYRQGGGFRFALEPEDLPDLRATYERDVKSGLPVELLSPVEVAELIPINPRELVMASYCATDGQANPVKTCEALAAASRAAGAVIREGEGAIRVEQEGGHYKVVTNLSSYTGRKAVIAAGPWSRHLLAHMGVRLPLTPRRPEMAETEEVPPVTESFVSLGDLRGYGRQTASGNFHVGVRSIDARLDEAESTSERVRQSLETWARLFPHLEGVRIVRTWTGYTNWTPDQSPIIGPVPKIEGLFVCTGFCGHGFALGPAVGFVMADLILDRAPDVDIAPLALDRFSLADLKPQ